MLTHWILRRKNATTFPYLKNNDESNEEYDLDGTSLEEINNQITLSLVSATFLILTIFKCMHLMLISQSTGRISHLIYTTFSSISLFFVVFLIYISVISIINKVLGFEIENSSDAGGEFGHDAEYPNLPNALKHFLISFRSSIGDI